MDYRPLADNLDKAYTGEGVRASLISALTAVNLAHHRTFWETEEPDDPSSHILEESEEEEETNG